MNRVPTLLLAAALLACGGDDEGPPQDANEPNDAFAQATPLTIGTPLVAVIATTADVDYYSFTVPAGGASVRFQTFDASGVTCQGNMDPIIGVFGDPPNESAPIAVSDDTGVPPLCEDLTVPLAEGTNYVGVAGWVAWFRYTLSVTIP